MASNNWMFPRIHSEICPPTKTISPVKIFPQIIKLYWFCFCFIAISIPVLPIVLTTQFLAVHSVAMQSCFVPLFAQLHHFAKREVYTTVKLLKLILLDAIDLIPLKHSVIKQYLFQYVFFYTACMTCYTLHTKWLVFATILLSGDVRTNPGPETLGFCCWNLNSIAVYDFVRISLIEAYNSVCNYDLIGIVETHIDSTIDKDRLARGGYTFHESNHPLDVKRGGVGLYVRDALPSKNRPDLVTLSDCIVCEIQLNKKKYFFVLIKMNSIISR